jgi:hypothetical protein
VISITSNEFKELAEKAFRESGRFELDKYGFMDGFAAAFLLASQGKFEKPEIDVDKTHQKN